MPKKTDGKSSKPKKTCPTHESTAYLGGMFHELQSQMQKYCDLTGQALAMEARVELAEKTLCLTRDSFAAAIKDTQDAAPNDWNKVMKAVQFVGVRLADACVNILQKQKKLTRDELLVALNHGMFRFRTNFPLREIHAALLRHPHVVRDGNTYTWVAPAKEEQLPMRLRIVQREMVTPEPKDSTGVSKEPPTMQVVESAG